MSRRRRDNKPKARLSPTKSVAFLTDDFMDDLDIPELPDQIPRRLEEAIVTRMKALFYHLKEAKKSKYSRPFEIRLVRDAHRIVLTAYELDIAYSQIYYAEFKELVEALGYERTDAGYKKKDPDY